MPSCVGRGVSRRAIFRIPSQWQSRSSINHGRGWPMNRRRLIALCVITFTVVLALLISSQTVPISAQGRGDEPDKIPPPYNPYPPGILPANLNSEIARVLREVDRIDAEALG